MLGYYDSFIAMDKAVSLPDRVQRIAETVLQRRAIRNQRKIARQQKKSAVREWLEALIWAVIVVFLINQYVFQLYQIPTSSMETTLLIKDRVFVNKFIYGPELYPQGPKIFDSRTPERDEIIVFENPNYVSRGPLFDTVNRIVYMLTLSLVNLDKDENGQPRSQLYVKRAIGLPGDTIRFVEGEIHIRPAGMSAFLSETQFRELTGLVDPHQRLISPSAYLIISDAARFQALRSTGSSTMTQDQRLVESVKRFQEMDLIDYYHYYQTYYKERMSIDPSDMSSRSFFARYDNGLYVPDGYFLPIGDNRDNSGDGRYFGPQPNESLLGKTILRFWPINRIGILH